MLMHYTGVEATNEWYSEIKDYTFSGEENLACGHFSQVVWAASERAGFGRAQAADGTVYVVCSIHLMILSLIS